MFPRMSTRPPLAALLLAASASSISAQTLDWGAWGTGTSGIYANGDTIAISSLVNGATNAAFNETSTPHIITDPAFPFDNAPGVNEFGYLHNAKETLSEWSLLIDLTDFSLNSSTVIGFSNLDGRSFGTLAPSYATLTFLDSSGAPVSISSASFIGNYDVNWQGFTWDANSTFNLSTGRWDVVADSGSTHAPGTYFAGVGDAFFLTNLPSNVEKIVYTKSGPTNYLYDSTLFYAGNVIPEPSSALLGGLAGLAFVLRRRRA